MSPRRRSTWRCAPATSAVPNDEPGIAGLVARLRPLAPALVVAEATGGFERAAIAALAAAGMPVVVANPRQVRDSGTLRGKRVVWGGRVGVRTALYLAALCGSPWNPALRPFYDRLRAAGKPKVALIACARKLLTILNAMVWDNAGWRAPDLPLQHSC